MTRHLGDWRQEIAEIDVELIRLFNRRTQLAMEILQTLRTEISLGDLARDGDRLMLILLPNNVTTDDLVLDDKAVGNFFSSVSKECRRLAENRTPCVSPIDRERTSQGTASLYWINTREPRCQQIGRQ